MNQSFYDRFTILENRFFKENRFVNMTPENAPLPTWEAEKDRLPRPVWQGHDDVLRCYDKTWKLAFGNLCRPISGAGFVSNFIDTAFNGCIFMWDSSFILMFGKYGARSFDFQATLNNFYSHQYADGYICREIEEDTGRDHFTRFDPAATGPDIMAWCEWEYFKNFGDRDTKEGQSEMTGGDFTIYAVMEQIDRIMIRRRKIERFIDSVKGLPELITEFDESLWASLVDSMTVYAKDRIVFQLTCGVEIES